MNPETMYEFIIDDTERVPLDSTELELVNPSETGDLCFRLCTDTLHVTLVLELFEEEGIQNFRFRLTPPQRSVFLRSGGKFQSLPEFFYTSAPKIWFADGSSLQGNELTEPKRPCAPYPRDSIQIWDWTGVDITQESQGVTKKSDTVQYRVIQELKAKDYTVIFDDDSSGEAADIIAIKEHERAIDIEFYHCKFSKEPLPGARIDDLYAVCGQAQKSIYWKEEPTELFSHLLRRESRRINNGLRTRFERGCTTDLLRITEKSRVCAVNLTICIVQPGLSVSQATREQLELLGVTETYLKETYQLPLSVFASS